MSNWGQRWGSILRTPEEADNESNMADMASDVGLVWPAALKTPYLLSAKPLLWSLTPSVSAIERPFKDFFNAFNRPWTDLQKTFQRRFLSLFKGLLREI